MRKTVFTMSLLTIGLLAVDFSQMTTQELIDMRGTVAVEDRDAFRAEMQSRVANMTTEERTALRNSRQASTVQRGGTKATPTTFAEFDSDGDGSISKEELTIAREARKSKNAEDGKLLRNAQNAPDFSTIDTNGDGSIDSTEFIAHQTTQMKNHLNNASSQRMRQGGQGRGQRQIAQGNKMIRQGESQMHRGQQGMAHGHGMGQK